MSKIILVHGFGFDPEHDGKHNPYTGVFPELREALAVPGAEGFGWYSVPLSVKGLWHAWGRAPRRWNRYRKAWDYSSFAATTLAGQLSRHDEPVSLVGHSLGTRVVLQAIDQLPPQIGHVDRVLLLNGAEFARNARPVALRHRDIRFTNIAVETDDVLDVLGDKFAPGRRGHCIGQLGLKAERENDPLPGNWCDIFLDDIETRDLAFNQRDWIIEGDNPRSYQDHWYSYRWRGNWPMLRAWAAGDDLAWLSKRAR